VAAKIPKTAAQKRVDATRHPSDGRMNIPTAELEAFATDEEKRPTKVLYPRDPTLDPQLVWKGKDEQDSHPLEVPSVPIYIQETISPQALIEDLRAHSKANAPEAQLDFFSDFNGLPFEERVEFYQHSQRWTNRMILGDSLLVMNSLAEKEGLKGQVQTIYIDPPYGIRFGSNWQVSTRKRDVRDGKAEDATRQPEQVRAFRDTWELGIHSYLAYLRDRLVVARDLLTESGSIFVQISVENMHLVRCLLDEVFGSDRHVATIAFQKTGGASTNVVPTTVDYLLLYAKDRARVKFRPLFVYREAGDTALDRYDYVETRAAEVRRATTDEMRGIADPDGRRLQLTSLLSTGETQSPQEFILGGTSFRPRAGSHWKTSVEGLRRLAAAGRIARTEGYVRYKRYADDFPVIPLTDRWESVQIGTELLYVVQTSTTVVQRCLLMTTDPGDLVFDPTCGSGTTAYVAEQWGRRWITIDTSRVALALARTRLMAARYPQYLLKDSAAGIAREAQLNGHVPPSPLPPTRNDVKQGFVYDRVPHVTLKSIAQNPDIHEGMSRAEIDAAIARHAETEVLYDRPYEDPKVLRVSGPFSVESLSPHRIEREGPEDDTAPSAPLEDATDYVPMVLANLRKAGVQNTVKGERLVFDRLEPWPGVYIQAAGDYTENGQTKSVAVALGPQFGTVGSELIRDAAKEAVRFADLLVVCGFAFEAIADDSLRLGRLTILKAKMNPDLELGDDLLKKTGAGNLFMVFGEPDIDVRRSGDELTVEIRGLDVYDPTTGAIRSHSVEDIATWFIDTDYDGNLFKVRHAYFLGGDDPYEKLRRALRADVNEDAWATLYSATSRPFPRPPTGRIAVKVINHFGDEILKVYMV
jgi:adenine-specific DNA-methyltransferase